MADDSTTTTPAETVTDDAGQQETNELDQLRAALAKANKDAEKHRLRNKELEPVAARARELEQSQMSEAEKAAARLGELERQTAEAQSEAIRLRVAVRYHIAEEDMDLLGTGTEEQIETRARRVSELAAAQTPATAATSRQPVEALRPGASPSSTTPLNSDPLLDSLKSTLGIS